MAKVSTRRIRAVAIFLIFIALAYAGFMTFGRPQPKTDIQSTFREANAHFRDAGSLHKTSVVVRSMNINSALDALEGIVDTYTLEKPLLKDIKGNHGLFIFKIRENQMNTVLEDISRIGSISEQKELVDSALVVKRLETEEAILASKRRDLAALDNADRIYGNITELKNQLIDEIRRLENTVYVLGQGDTTLLYVQLLSAAGGRNVSVLRTFFTRFGIALAVLFVGTVLLYYGTKLLMYLLSLLGFKGFSSGVFGSGSYPYGGHSGRYYSRHGYSGGRRKIKRIYKGKPGPPPQEEGEHQDQQQP